MSIISLYIGFLKSVINVLKMEELGDPWDFHLHHDLGILYDDSRRTSGANDNGEVYFASRNAFY